MRKVVPLLLSLIFVTTFLLEFSSARRVLLYAGFNHLIEFETTTMKAGAYDIRRYLAPDSTCDLLRQPPLFKDAQLKDWLSQGIIESKEENVLDFSYMGYELFLIENKLTGAYLIRRCRDFRPQLTELPCESYATGNSEFLKGPNKTIFIGNNRAIILNIKAGFYSVHPFDADVHTGGDPFKFVSGPLFSGIFPVDNLDKATSFNYLQLKDHQGDVLVIHYGAENKIKAIRFNGLAKSHEDMHFKVALETSVPNGFAFTALGENELFSYNNSFSFERYSFSVDEKSNLVTIRGNSGNGLINPEGCIYDNVTACALQSACAWCPSTYTCANFDRHHNTFCDLDICSAEGLTNPYATDKAIILPECFTNPDPNSVHDDLFDVIWSGEQQLPGNVRFPDEYRKSIGDPANSEAAPIHPVIDNELGDTWSDNRGKFQDEVIDEMNNVAQGKVYLPPVESKAVPCMDKDYLAGKASESTTIEEWKMNHPSLPENLLPKIPTTSPTGDSTTAAESKDCVRQLNQNKTGSVNITRGYNASASFQPSSTNFVPRQGALLPESPDFIAAATSTRFEEDIMNSDKTKFAELKAMTNGKAVEIDDTRSPLNTTDSGFKPKEPSSHQKEPTITVPIPAIRAVTASDDELMNQGFEGKGLVGADCTDDGGQDAKSTLSFNSAMMKSIKPAFPTIEEQLVQAKSIEAGRPENFMGSVEGQ